MEAIIFKKDCFPYDARDIVIDPGNWIWKDDYKDCWKFANAQEIWDEIDKKDQWDFDLCKVLCDMAGLGDEYDSSDQYTFEGIIFKSAEKLGVS